jgi:ketosteroid isomerase-like protein
MTHDAAVATARSIVAALQAAVDARDLDELAALFHEDGLLAGTTAYNQGPAVRAYLKLVVEQDASLRWELPRIDVFHEARGVLGFGGLGEIVIAEDGVEERAPFRLTVLAVETPDGWRLKQFHGSIPSDA